MDNSETPIYYTDLSQDELKFMLVYNQTMMNKTDSPEMREYYLRKTKYISSLIEE